MAAAAAAAAQPRVMVLPFPAQGHVMPLMELSHRLVEHGFEVDFVNSHFNHDRVVKALAAAGGGGAGAAPAGIHLFSVPDGMAPDDDRTDVAELGKTLPEGMLGPLSELVVSRNIRWVVADVSMSWVLELAATQGVRVVLFSTFSAAVFALRMHLPKIVEDGIIDESANVKRNERIQLSPDMPAIYAAELPWVSLGKSSSESRRGFITNVLKTLPVIALADTIVCNTFRDIESAALALLPEAALAIGPLQAPKSMAPCHFWPEDHSCLAWLDAQAPGSVVYVAFGSLAIFDATQVEALADGLVLTGRPFLWVLRADFAAGVGDGWLDEFRRRVGGVGMVVGWAPQQRVLAHPSVACFVTHCGWNSTMEGMQHGLPFLCWPYFGDQFCNESYVCDVWRTGVRISAGERGAVTKEEFRDKVALLLGDEGIKARALALKSAARATVSSGGPSQNDLLKLVDLLRQQ